MTSNLMLTIQLILEKHGNVSSMKIKCRPILCVLHKTPERLIYGFWVQMKVYISQLMVVKIGQNGQTATPQYRRWI